MGGCRDMTTDVASWHRRSRRADGILFTPSIGNQEPAPTHVLLRRGRRHPPQDLRAPAPRRHPPGGASSDHADRPGPPRRRARRRARAPPPARPRRQRLPLAAEENALKDYNREASRSIAQSPTTRSDGPSSDVLGVTRRDSPRTCRRRLEPARARPRRSSSRPRTFRPGRDGRRPALAARSRSSCAATGSTTSASRSAPRSATRATPPPGGPRDRRARCSPSWPPTSSTAPACSPSSSRPSTTRRSAGRTSPARGFLPDLAWLSPPTWPTSSARGGGGGDGHAHQRRRRRPGSTAPASSTSASATTTLQPGTPNRIPLTGPPDLHRQVRQPGRERRARRPRRRARHRAAAPRPIQGTETVVDTIARGATGEATVRAPARPRRPARPARSTSRSGPSRARRRPTTTSRSTRCSSSRGRAAAAPVRILVRR